MSGCGFYSAPRNFLACQRKLGGDCGFCLSQVCKRFPHLAFCASPRAEKKSARRIWTGQLNLEFFRVTSRNFPDCKTVVFHFVPPLTPQQKCRGSRAQASCQDSNTL